MKKRNLGTTGIQVSELILGGGYVGGLLLQSDKSYCQSTKEEAKLKAVQHALDSGINMIDTAPSYGNGESERSVGKLLPQIAPRPYLATKVQIHPSERKDLAGQVEKSIHDSLTRLETSSVDILQLHNPLKAVDDKRHLSTKHLFGKTGIINALEKAKNEGITKHIGMTALGDTNSCILALETDAFETAQIYYNLLNPSAGTTIPKNWAQQDFSGIINVCEKRGVGVMNIRVFAAGILASTERTGREIPVTGMGEFNFAEDESRAAQIFKYLPDEGYTTAQEALRFSLANRRISCVVLGLANFDQLEEALAVNSKPPMPDSSLKILNKLYEENFSLDV